MATGGGQEMPGIGPGTAPPAQGISPVADEESDKENMENQRNMLIERMESEFGLLDKLCRSLTVMEIAEVESKATPFEKNKRLLELIFENDKHQDLIKALTETRQTHLVNWVRGNGEYSVEYVLDWPLNKKEIEILRDNLETLTDIVDPCELVGLLFSKKVINKRQMDFIQSKRAKFKKNGELLKILRRCSLNAYYFTIDCLRASNQCHIADILEGIGAVVSAHAVLYADQLDEKEIQIVSEMASLLLQNVPENRTSLMLQELQIKIIAARRGSSIVLYIYCKTLEELTYLCEVINKKELNNRIENLFNALLHDMSTRVIDLYILETEINKAKKFFEPTIEDAPTLKSSVGVVKASARDGSNPARENTKELRRFQELFVGRFDTKEAVAIMERFKYNAEAAVDFVLTASHADVKKLIEDEQASASLAKEVEDLNISGSLLNEAKLGHINTTTRLFACKPCDRFWWRRTPERKQVSKCYRCNVRYDPVPRDQEWGWAQFECPKCTRKFSGYCEMQNTSPCYNCEIEVAPYSIQPPTWKRGRRSTNTHRCDAPDCGGCLQPRGSSTRVAQAGGRRRVEGVPLRKDGFAGGDLRNTDPGATADYDLSQGTDFRKAHEPPEPRLVTCVHPSTRRAQNREKVIYPSRPHDSSGSTVDTFLTQADFDRASVISSRMSPIDENRRSP